MKRLRLDIDGIHEYQQNRPPFLMIDLAEEVIPGVSAKGYKDLKPDEWFFGVHFLGDPTMPGMLQIEALIQMSALAVLTLPGNKGKVAYVTSIDRARFTQKVVPGDRLYIETQLHDWKRGLGKASGRGFVDAKMVCEADFVLVLPDLLRQYQPN